MAYCALSLDIVTPRALNLGVIEAIEKLVAEGYNYPFSRYDIWYKRFIIGCLAFPLPECNGCERLKKLYCAKCKNSDPITHHTSYRAEAVPTLRNREWLNYYKLLCESCHRKEHYRHPELNHREQWDAIVLKAAGWGSSDKNGYIILTKENLKEWKLRGF